jgi:TolB-like protein
LRVRPSQEHTSPLLADGQDTATVVDPDHLPVSPTHDQLREIARAIGLPARFELIGLLGRGGMGFVLEARDARLGREVALKVLSRTKKYDHIARARFEQEARAVARLADPSIVAVHELSDSGDYMVMELIRGETLRDRLARDSRLPVDEVRRLGRALCRALAVAHAARIVHRDVKPSNVLYEAPSGRILLTDFGIATLQQDTELTATGTTLGTPAYMAPEQLRSASVDARADLYSVGATLFEAVTGRRLNGPDGPCLDPAAAILEVTGDETLARTIVKATSIQPTERHRSADELAAELAADPEIPTAIGMAPVRVLPAHVRPTPHATPAEPARAKPPTEPPPATHPPAARWKPPTSPPRPAGRPRIGEPRIAWSRVIAAIVAVFLVAGGITYLALRRRASGDDTRPNLIAVLPFENRSADPALGFAQLGLATVVSDELQRTTVLERIAPDQLDPANLGSDPARWLAEARARHATTIVRGTVSDLSGGGVQLRVEVLRGHGAPVVVLERRSSPAEVANVLRAGVASFAGTLVDPRDIQGYLERGHLALIEDRISDAHKHYTTVLLHDPNHLDAIYQRAIATWWNSATPDPTIVALDEALAKPISPAQREVLLAYRLLVDVRFPEAIAAFTALAARRPDDFHIVYGLFEAQFHGGQPADAMVTFNRLRVIEPRIHIGLMHVLGFLVAHPDTPGLAWARALLGTNERSRFLLARKLVSERDYRAAGDLLANVDAGITKNPSIEFALVRIHLDLATDRFDDAASDLDHLDGNPVVRLTYQLALAYARHDAGKLAAALTDEKLAVLDKANQSELAELVPLVIALDHPGLRARVLAGLERQPGWARRAVSYELARTLLGTPATTPSPYPEVAATARALAAERAQQWPAAAAAWRDAAARSLEGRSMAVAFAGVAHALHAAGDLRGAELACRDVLEPRYLQPHWSVAAEDCLVWSVEGALDREDRRTAQAFADRLARLREPAGADDPVVRRARALLQP